MYWLGQKTPFLKQILTPDFRYVKFLQRKLTLQNNPYSSIDEAFKIEEKAHSNTQDTWGAIFKDFENKCNMQDIQAKEATVEKHQLILRIKEFLMKAHKYSEECPNIPLPKFANLCQIFSQKNLMFTIDISKFIKTLFFVSLTNAMH